VRGRRIEGRRVEALFMLATVIARFLEPDVPAPSWWMAFGAGWRSLFA